MRGNPGILESREYLDKLIGCIASANQAASVLCVSPNIPGPDKMIFPAGHLFADCLNALLNRFHHADVLSQTYVDGIAFHAAIIVVRMNPYQAKRISLEVETDDFAGYFCDIDVYAPGGKVSRGALREKERPCYLCGGQAKACIFYRRHTPAEILLQIQKRYMEHHNLYRDKGSGMDQYYITLYSLLKPYCNADLNEDSNLFESGLNSFNMVNILVEIEKRYQFEFDDEELDIRGINTIRNLSRLIIKKQQGERHGNES